MFKTRDENTELMIDLIQGALEEEGCETKRFSDSDKHKTTDYDAIEVKGYDGNYYTINISKRTRSRDDLIHMENEVFDTI